MARKGLSQRFKRNDKGSMAILFGLLIPMLLGFTGLAADGAFWLMARNRLQAATDGAAISAAHSMHLDGSGPGITLEARKLFKRTYGEQLDSMEISVVNPPGSGAFAGDTSAVEVTSSRQQRVYFAALVGMTDVTLASRSVARVDAMSDACLLGLSPEDDKAVEITGSTIVNLSCGIASNSNSPEALYMSGSSTTTATSISAVGDIYQSSGSTLNTTDGSVRSRAPKIDDPYGAQGRNLQVPKHPTACLSRNTSVRSNTTLQPGRYCGGITFQSGTATLEPGVYIIDGGDFRANAQASIIGDGVTIILTGNGNKYAQLNVAGGAEIALHAPKSGTDFDGVLFFQDPDAPSYKGANVSRNKLNGGSNFEMSGAVYFPSQGLDFSGGADARITCLQLVAYKLTFTGNSEIASVCDENSGTERISRLDIRLVE